MSRACGISSNSFTGYFSKTQFPPKIRCQTGRDSSTRKSSSQTKPKMFDGCLGRYCLNSENLTSNASLKRPMKRQNDGTGGPMLRYLPARTPLESGTVRILHETSSGDFEKRPYPSVNLSAPLSSRQASCKRNRGLAD